MGEQSVTCPKCNFEVRLTESIAAPLLSKVRAECDHKLFTQRAEMSKREKQLEERRAEIKLTEANIKAKIEAQVASRLETQKSSIALIESAKAKKLFEEELVQKEAELQQQNTQLTSLNEKLKKAQDAQATLNRKEMDLQEAQRELNIKISEGVHSGLEEVRLKARREVETVLDLKVKDREHIIEKLRYQIDSLNKRAEQGSPQVRGEVLELKLEQQLKSRFPHDEITPVPNGRFGGDVIQKVIEHGGQECGIILWEAKRTRSWRDEWLGKLREDQRVAGADLAVIVSQALPKDIEHFDYIDGIWVSSMSCTIPVAIAMRQAILQIAQIKRSGEGHETKVQQVYEYLTGPRFKHRVESIVEKFSDMKEDLDKERRMMTKQWAKREQQIRCVINATAGMYGDLQGIAGKSLKEIDALDSKMFLG